MASPLAAAIAALRQRPMLAVAGAGVAAVLVFTSTRKDPDATAAVAEGAVQRPVTGSVQSYALPGGLAPADLGSADLANAIREGNAAVISAINAGRVAAQPQPPTSPTIPGIGSVQPLPVSPTPPTGAGPVAPPPTAVRVETNRPVSRATLLRREQDRLRAGGTATITYIVRAGDSLSAIANRYGTPGGWSAIYAANRNVVGANPNLIHPGMRLSVTATRGI
jgi:nucleoid-associated protein YgaU